MTRRAAFPGSSELNFVDAEPLKIERAISPREAAIVGWLLEHAAVGDVSGYRLRPAEELRVVGGCDCGCCSLEFQPKGWGKAEIVAEAYAVYPDGQQAGLILWGRNRELVLLEVYDCHVGASHRTPEISDLRLKTK
jgi:hypothetical protein